MNDLGRSLIMAGLVLVLAGVVIGTGIGKGWLGRLPGDFHYSKGGFSLHLPIASCLLVSLVLSVVWWLFRK